MLSGLIDWFKAKVSGRARLIIEYILLGILVAVAGYSVNSYLQIRSLSESNDTLNTKVGQLSSDYTRVVDVNKEQQSSIDQLKGLRETDAHALSGLHDELEKNGKKTASVSAKVSQLERNNVEAKKVLDTAVPRDLGCLRADSPECPAPASSTDQN